MNGSPNQTAGGVFEKSGETKADDQRCGMISLPPMSDHLDLLRHPVSSKDDVGVLDRRRYRFLLLEPAAAGRWRIEMQYGG